MRIGKSELIFMIGGPCCLLLIESMGEEEEDGSSDGEDEGDEELEGVTDGVDSMDVDGETKRVKPSADPNDLSAFKMDEYDEEESSGVGELVPILVASR